jgi:hypothetical protein
MTHEDARAHAARPHSITDEEQSGGGVRSETNQLNELTVKLANTESQLWAAQEKLKALNEECERLAKAAADATRNWGLDKLQAVNDLRYANETAMMLSTLCIRLLEARWGRGA